MSRLVVILPVQPLRVDDAFTLREWPFHVTVAPTFVNENGLPAVLPAVTPILLTQSVLRLTVGPVERFGRALNVPVSLVEPTAELSRLHARLVAALSAVGALFDDPEFTGAGFRPHITLKGVPALPPGADLSLRQAAIVDMAPEGERRVRTVVWTTELT